MIKHTPGPWQAFNHSWSDTSITAPGFDHAICRLDINHATEESQEADEAQMAANACLIAAAPSLLDALCAIVGALEATGGHGRLTRIGKAAITRAIGESDAQDPGIPS